MNVTRSIICQKGLIHYRGSVICGSSKVKKNNIHQYPLLSSTNNNKMAASGLLSYFSPKKLRSNSSGSHVNLPPVSTPLSTTNASKPESGDTLNDSQKLSRITALFERLVPDVESIKHDVKTVKADIEKLTADTNDIVQGMATEINALKSEVVKLKYVNQKLIVSSNLVTDRINKLECYSRRNNLLLYHVEESQAPLRKTIDDVFGKMGIDNPQTMAIEGLHRVGPPSSSRVRPIIVRFLHRLDRKIVWDARSKLKGSKIVLAEDFPDDYKNARSSLMPVVKAARSSGLKASLVMNKALIDGSTYGIHNLHKLPAKCNPETACTKITDKTVCYFGRYSPLSNFHIAPFKVDSVYFNCMEQFLQKSRAELLKRDDIAQQILATDDPLAQKRLGDSVRTNDISWINPLKDQLLPALTQKFCQNPPLKDYLIATRNKTLGEACRNDLWGIGFTLNCPETSDPNLWRGKNLMGELLMRVRQELKS